MDSLSKEWDLFFVLFITWWSGRAIEFLWVFLTPFGYREILQHQLFHFPAWRFVFGSLSVFWEPNMSVFNLSTCFHSGTLQLCNQEPRDSCCPFSRLLPKEGGAVIWKCNCFLNRFSTHLPVASLSSSQLREYGVLPLPEPVEDSAV